MGAADGELGQFELCRMSKHRQMLERFPFMRAHRSRWSLFGRRWTEKERLRIYHALAPFRELGEFDAACSVILTASQRRRGRAPLALERLLVGLRYLEATERRAVYRDPSAWLERVGRLTGAAIWRVRVRQPLPVPPAAKAVPTSVEARAESTPESKAA